MRSHAALSAATNELIQSNVARAVANASSIDPAVCNGYSVADALMFAGVMPNLLKLLETGRVPRTPLLPPRDRDGPLSFRRVRAACAAQFRPHAVVHLHLLTVFH